ncbi:MAG TPA: TonB family protein [Longimicrobium sp.]|nr:TonB family protein [Longimicrobium sp.]
MRTLLILCILLFTRTSLAHAQAGTPRQAPPAAGAVEGDVYLRMQNGDIRKMAAGRVHLVPDSVVRSLVAACEVRDSSRKRYVRLRRPIRLAYDEARGARGDARARFLARADSATTAAVAALEPGRRAENEIIAQVAAQRAAQTGMEAHYTFEGVAPGQYWLYSDTDLPYYWFAPVRTAGERVKRDLDNSNVTRVVVDKTYMTAADVCAHTREVPDVPGDHRDVEERQPALANRSEVQRALWHRFPRALRSSGSDGSVTVRFKILENGRVDPETVEAIESSVPEAAARAETEAAAELVAEGMRFDPALIDGRPVKVWVTIPITFHSAR